MSNVIDSFPKRTISNLRGEVGVNIVARIVNEKFGWLFKRNHQENDFGVDAYIEIVTAEGFVTGQMIAMQIKCGESFLEEKNRWGYIFRGEKKHLSYLSNSNVPVLVVLCDPKTEDCYWVEFCSEQAEATGTGWKITVPFANELNSSKEKICALLPPVVDSTEEFELYSMVNKGLKRAQYIHFVIDKGEVDSSDFSWPRKFFDRLQTTRELAFECQGKVEISFHGYENDSRELIEIESVREYIKALDQLLPELFFFAWVERGAHTLKLFMLCQTEFQILAPSDQPKSLLKITYETKALIPWMERHWIGLNRLTDELAMSLEENKKISFAVMKAIGIPTEQISG